MAAPTNASEEGWFHLAVRSVAPSLRDSAAMTYDAKDGYVLLFGGCSKPVCPLPDTWRYMAGAWTNLTGAVAINPTARYGAAMAYDARDGYVVMFGGNAASGALGDTWTFEFGRWTQVATTPATAPSPRYDAGLLYDALDSETVLFGGESGTGAPLSDTWTFAGGAWTNITASAGPAPAARFSAGFGYDALDHLGILFGGTGLCGASCSDTWGFESGRWTNLTAAVGTNVPSPRSEVALTYDVSRGELVLVGGQDTVVLADMWGFTHGLWTYLAANTTTSPGPRADLSAAYDPADGYLLTYGGHSTVGLHVGTWVLLTPLSTTVLPELATVATGQADQFMATSYGGYGSVSFAWNFGDGSPVVTGASAGHTYFVPGTFPVTATATDGLGVTVSAAATIAVVLPPFAVTITASPAAPRVGQTVTFLAAATGGTAPYNFQWSGDVSSCSGLTAPALSCTASVAGTVAVSITVVDVTHRNAVGSTSITFSAAASNLAGRGTTASLGSSTSGLPSTFTSAYLTVAIFAACAVGVVTYRAGRRREAARNALRPLCYAVPAWSETPADFPDGTPSSRDDASDRPSLLE